MTDQLCRICQEGVPVGANQCVMADGRNLRITNHSAGQAILVQAADIDDLVKAIEIARKVRTL